MVKIYTTLFLAAEGGEHLCFTRSDFLASDYCYEIEMKIALQRTARNEAIVIPVTVRRSDWQTTALGELQALPYYAVPIIEWENPDKAFV